MCTGAILLYKIPTVVIGENKTLKGPESYSKKFLKLVNLDLPECKQLMADFVEARPELWREDTGE
jgi:cytosine deaminase